VKRDSPAGALLVLDEVSVSYGKEPVLHGVSLEVMPGRTVALLGPNGAGKTTILKTICGLVQPDEGKIWFEGERLDKLEVPQRVERGVVYVPEGMRVFPEMSIIENLEIGAYLSRRLIDERMGMIFNLFPELNPKRDMPAKLLSGGEQRMVTLARGLMSGARLLLLDDPLQGLSPIAISRFCEAFRALRKSGLTFLIAGQHVRRILLLADHAFLIEAGKVTLSGESSNVLHNDHFQQILFGLANRT
jgi:branched-chain amino acid transport system ATP-binding protein